MKRIFFLIIFFCSFSTCYSQNKELIGKWILVKTLYSDGRKLEVNNSQYSTNAIFRISPNNLNVNDQNFVASFTPTQIKTQYRTINYVKDKNYLVIQDAGDDKASYFLLVDDFIKKYPEFSLKEIERNGDTIYLDNNLSGYELAVNLNFDEFMRKNMPDRNSKDYDKLYFKIEFILTADNKFKDIKVLHSIDEKHDNDYIRALKKSEIYFKNISGKDLLITKETLHGKFLKDLKDENERKFYEITANGITFYRNNKFEKAIEAFSQIKNLRLEEHRFKLFIKQAMVMLGISYLAVGKNEEACQTFNEIGDKTDFEIRNFLIDFCEKK